MATFGYGRVSTQDQTTANQRMEIERAGYSIDYWHADEGVSGAVLAAERPQFRDMLGKIRSGESVVVTKIDRLGRDAVDIQQTVKQLKALGVRVFVTQLGATDPDEFGRQDAARDAGGVRGDGARSDRGAHAGGARSGTGAGGAPWQAIEDERGRPHSDPSETGRGGESVSAVARSYAISRASVIEIRKAP